MLAKKESPQSDFVPQRLTEKLHPLWTVYPKAKMDAAACYLLWSHDKQLF